MRKNIFVIFFVLLNILNVTAQQQIDSVLNKAFIKYPQEKMYIQLDKSFYNSGETIWFKAYLTANNEPSKISKTLYAELINSEGTILQRKIIPIIQSGAASQFELEDSSYNSKLYIRAYTSWMLNFDSSLIYLKPLSVYNIKPAKKKSISPFFTLNLFAEGGDLIENTNCKVAFKTNNQDGIPFDVSGNILDSKNTIITNFSSIHNGMGFFNITPISNEKYKAIWKDKIGITHETDLPIAKSDGINLSVINNKLLKYTLSRNATADEVFKSLTVIAQINNQIVYSAKINLHNKTLVTAPIIADSFPDGILQITVFNAAQIPVAERVVFVNNNNYFFNTDLHIVEKNITKHGKSVLQLDVGNNYLSNLSIAVTDASIDIGNNNKENIFSAFLLTSDLKGTVYNPAYYFLSDEDSVKQQLDLVMMTNGWRRYKWEDLLTNKWPLITHQPDNYLNISGSVYGLSKIQLKNKTITAILKTSGNSNSIFSIPVAEDGKFNVDGLYFFDTARLAYQFNNDKEKILTSTGSFKFNTSFEKSPNTNFSYLSNLIFNSKPDSSILLKSLKQSALQRSIDDMKNTKTLDAVIIKSKQKPLKDKLNDEYTSGLFSSGDARIFTTEDDPFAKSAISILDYLRGKVAGLQISTDGDGSITRRGSNTDVFLNESHTDISMLQSTPMSDVAMIKVFDPPFFGSMGGGAGGAVAVYTKKGANNSSNAKGLNSIILYGYSAIKQFYMPDYEKLDAINSPDYRTTLYWNPFIFMDAKKRRVTIPIFNNDNCKKIRVIIEGINELGQLTREEKIFE